MNQADRDALLLLPGINRKEAEEIIAGAATGEGFCRLLNSWIFSSGSVYHRIIMR